MHKNGSFPFSRDMRQRGIQDDDAFFNWTIEDTMTMLSSGLPFRARHEIPLTFSNCFSLPYRLFGI
jgi:hypothetical protein